MYFQESPHNFFSRWLTTAEMFGHFPACLCCVTCQPRAEGLACASTYILTMLNCIVSAHSLTNLKRRVSFLHTSLNRQFDVHYCLEPLQFSHGYQRKEQLMAIFFSHTQAALFLSHKRKSNQVSLCTGRKEPHTVSFWTYSFASGHFFFFPSVICLFKQNCRFRLHMTRCTRFLP